MNSKPAGSVSFSPPRVSAGRPPPQESWTLKDLPREFGQGIQNAVQSAANAISDQFEVSIPGTGASGAARTPPREPLPKAPPESNTFEGAVWFFWSLLTRKSKAYDVNAIRGEE